MLDDKTRKFLILELSLSIKQVKYDIQIAHRKTLRDTEGTSNSNKTEKT